MSSLRLFKKNVTLLITNQMKKTSILTLLMCCNLAVALAQSAPTFNVSNLQITREVLNNVGDKTLSVLTITNKGKETLPATGWTLYFNSK